MENNKTEWPTFDFSFDIPAENVEETYQTGKLRK
jgi:hypothetical protein